MKRTLRVLSLVLLVIGSAGCGKKVPSNPVSEEPTVNSVPSDPWVVRFADGSANVWRFERTSAGGPVAWVYDPVTPAESSTGFYSGGEPGEGTLTDAQTSELWARIAAIEADTEHHIDARAKGTWQVTVEGAKPSLRMISDGAAVDAAVAFLGTVHSP